MSLPEKDKQARINDISKMLLPEMVPDQLRLLGLSEADIGLGDLAQTRAQSAAGIELVKLLNKRAQTIKERQSALYASRSTSKHPSQLELVLDNIEIFMQQASTLTALLSSQPTNEPIFALVDRLIETSIQIGYSAGSNDSLALTDRYTNSGYKTSVTKPQSGGRAKAKAIDPMKALVCDMACHVYNHQELLSASKDMLAEAIHTRLSGFSNIGTNENIPMLKKFAHGCPEHESIKRWIKVIKKNKSLPKPPKPSLDRLVEELKATYKNKAIKKSLNI
ncbi:hypothetical protein BEL05_15620 [Shewanella colwelliana]|uniref:Uncharacterized protein n=1 Tax=Shewanella colwelliana TaxID=23 RepID=A0A1E5ITR3_SHECO|nr:hypothetical protein [Shewanella colwelliana]OEG73876.1 hypothetical protein BEL05_15620 [Shewanella colwelliana]